MRELVPVVKCDRCDDPVPVETPSSIITVNLSGDAPRRYAGENCESCRQTFDEALTQLLGDYLVVDDTRPRKPRTPRGQGTIANERPDKWRVEDRTCPLPECAGRVPSKTRSAFSQHLKTKHGKTLADVGMNKIAVQGRRSDA